MDAAYAGAVHVSDRTIDSHIRNIRRKFTDIDDKVDLIGTSAGVGLQAQEFRMGSIYSKIAGL